MATKFENAVDKLQQMFPEYNIQDKENIELAHVVYADFAEYIVERIEKEDSANLVSKVVEFINTEFADSSADDEFLNLLQVEFFEHFAQSKPAIELARASLRGEARKYFEKTLEFTGLVDPVDPEM